jgi:PAS domain-containing protein
MRALYGADIALGGRLPDYQTVAADREASTANLERALAGERVTATAFSGENESRLSFGVVHVPQTDPHGTVVGVVVRAYDVTESRRAEEQLRASEEDYRALAEAVPQIVHRRLQPDGRGRRFGRLPALTAALLGAARGKLLRSC